jgi:phosphatidylglycerophosphate synthase
VSTERTEHTYGPTALLTPANMMTGFRLIVAPFFIYLLIFDRISWWTTIVGLSVAASDYFDGIIARRHGTTTSGAFLDPLADKVIVLGGLYAIIISRPHGIHFFVIPAIIITLREIWMSVFRAPSEACRYRRADSPSGRPLPKTGGSASACCRSPATTWSSPSSPSGLP